MRKPGRPRTYQTPQELEAVIDLYFEQIAETEKPPTVSGLALFLGFADRSSIYNYKDNEEFSHTIKRAITRIEQYCEEQLLSGTKCTGAIFWAKNHGWRDNRHIDFNDQTEKKNGFEFVDSPNNKETDNSEEE